MKALHGNGSGRTGGALVRAGVVGLLLAVMAATESYAVQFTKVCDDNISEAHRAAVEEAVDFLEHAALDILKEVESDPKNRNFVSIGENAADNWLDEVDDLVSGKILIACHEAGQWDGTIKNCQDPDKMGWTNGSKMHLCLGNWAAFTPSTPALLVGILAHELAHGVDGLQGHQKACWAADGDKVATNGKSYSRTRELPAGVFIARCKRLKDCPAIADRCDEKKTYRENPNSLAETIGLAGEDVAMGRVGLRIKRAKAILPDEFRPDLDTAVGIKHASIFPTGEFHAEVEVFNDSLGDYHNLSLIVDWGSGGFSKSNLSLAAGESQTFTIRESLDAIAGEMLDVFAEVYYTHWENRWTDLVTDLASVPLVDSVSFPIRSLPAAAVVARSGPVCGDLPWGPGAQSSAESAARALEKLDVRLARQCFNRTIPPPLLSGLGAGIGPDDWDQYCQRSCERDFEGVVLNYGTARVTEKSTWVVWANEIRNSCFLGPHATPVELKNQTLGYSAWDTKLEGSGTCSCTCVLEEEFSID